MSGGFELCVFVSHMALAMAWVRFVGMGMDGCFVLTPKVGHRLTSHANDFQSLYMQMRHCLK